ncbi:MAG: spore cortex-lytic enzyme [Eubacteriaceae bacterium]|nr:spore cortex-lytic enzyme [Eubacteriaceae bacterium]
MKKRKTSIIVACVAFALAVTLGLSAFTTIYYGSTDYETLKKVQTKLKNWGYYTGSVDGVYGYKTEQAVKWFQSANGLAADGKIGPKTMEALGMQVNTSQNQNQSGSSNSGSSGSSSNNDTDVMLLARCINGEGRGEPYEGQVAIAAVILNRVKDSGFPNTISGVIYQSGAFDAVKDGQINLDPQSSTIRAAKDALAGWDPSGGALYYYNPVTATNQWIRTRQIIATIGNHVFCK